MTLLNALLALIAAAPGEYAAIKTLYGQTAAALSTSDQATVDAALAAIAPELDADVAQLDADAKAAQVAAS